MRIFPLSATILLGTTLLAQTAPAAPTLKWRGSIWGSAVTQDRVMPDGSLVFRPVEVGSDSLSLDGLILGGDVALANGFSLKFTTLTGHMGKVFNAGSGESGNFAYPEAMLVWTGEKDTFKFGRMITFIGMEFLDGAANMTASRGLLFDFADPFNQVGLNWHHAFSPDWSTDVWAFNGEDRIKDNNRGKTFGLGLTYNHGGAADKYASLHVYRGPEQDGFGEARDMGAEGRMRERFCMMGQWTWGPATVVWEASLGREAFTKESLAGLTGNETATWAGFGAIFRYAVNDRWGIFARAESLKDDTGVRLAYDPGIRASLDLDLPGGGSYVGRKGADLRASSLSLGVERRMGQAFLRFEVRQDRLNKDLTDKDGKGFRSGTSATLGLGASF